MVVPSPLYPHYIRCYERLAHRLQVEPLVLYRQVWAATHARIEGQFDRSVLEIARESTGQPLSLVQRDKLRLAARTLFASARFADIPDDGAIDREWESAI